MERTPKSDKQIKEEIAKLEEMKPNVRRSSSFGDDHHEAIDAQVEVLKEQLDNDEIYDRFEDGPQNVLDAALEAMGWMDGGSYGEGERPSKNWAELVR